MVSPSMVLLLLLFSKKYFLPFSYKIYGFQKDYFDFKILQKKISHQLNLMRLCNRISVETVSELEGMIQSQNQVMAKLKDECHNLTQRLEESSERHK